MKINHLISSTAILIITSGCVHMGQDLSTSMKINSLKNSSAAKPYIAVVNRAEKAYNKGDLTMANNLIAIVDKKIASNSSY